MYVFLCAHACARTLFVYVSPLKIKKFDSLTTSKVASSSAGLKEDISDSHLNRLQHLRNELNYINETDWMYESLEKKPQQ